MRRLFFVILALVNAPALAAVQLDKLTQCEEIRKIWDDLRAGDPDFAQQCVSPSGRINRAIARKLGAPHSGLDLCFLRKPPVAFLYGFDCYYTWSSSTSAGVECTREIPRADVTSYFAQHDTDGGKAGNAYVRRVSDCLHGRGNAGTAPRTFGLSLVSNVARFEFGFAMSLVEAPVSGQATHSFSSLDPSLFGNDAAVEVLSIFIGTPPDKAKLGPKGEPMGKYIVDVDQGTEFCDAYVKAFRDRFHLRIVCAARFFDINTAAEPYESDREKAEHLDNWQDILATELMHNDFERATDRDLEHAQVPPISELQGRIIESMPYGMRERGSAQLSRKFLILYNQWSPDCVHGRGGGGSGAIVMGIKPRALVNESNGSVAVLAYGTGSCGNEEGKDYLDEVMRKAEEELVGAFKHGG